MPTIQPSDALDLRGITKTFGDLVALDGVDLTLRAGQVHALLGANGSGKSTLVKVMSGAYRPEGGELLAAGGSRRGGFDSPAEAAALGIRVIHQEAPLIDSLDVTESVATFRGYGTSGLGRIGWRKLRREVQELLDRMDIPVRENTLCREIGPADRAGIALAIIAGDAFRSEASTDASTAMKVLIVDEVTAAIPVSETQRHLERFRALADRGIAVLMVTHRLDELRICDDITLLRGGKVIYREDGGPRLSTHELVQFMVGGQVEESRDSGTRGEFTGMPSILDALWSGALPVSTGSRDGNPAGDPVIAVEGLAVGALQNCSFNASAGEVVGFSGLRGSGLELLPLVLAGDLRPIEGRIRVAGDVVDTQAGPRAFIRAGVTTVPADRLRSGGVGNLTVDENVALPTLRGYWHRSALLQRVVTNVIRAFDVRPPEGSARFGGLSGGNQQKVLIGKWLLLHPRVLVLGDPTYGVDPGAREAIFAAIKDAAAHGICVLFFSTEPEQLVRVCDRVLILGDGAITKELSGSSLKLDEIMEWSEK